MSLILFFLAFVITSVQAQKKDYFQGYIIDQEGQLIEGWVKGPYFGKFP